MKFRKTVANKHQLQQTCLQENLGCHDISMDSSQGYPTGTRFPWMHSSSSLGRVSRPSGKGRFGKRAPICLDRQICENSSDSGFECDWNSQSESQFGWRYTNSHQGLVDHSEDSNTQASNVSSVSIPKFPLSPYVEVKPNVPQNPNNNNINNNNFDLKTLGDISPVKDLTPEISSEQKLLSLLGKRTMSPDSTMRSPNASSPSGNNSTTGATSTPSPVPSKRPRFNFSAPAASKPTGLKLRNQNGVHMRNNSSVGKRLPPGTTPTLTSNLSPVSRDGRVHLQILAQPEVQHRARYQTEGSRGAIKDRKCNGFPTVKLFGYDKPATLQIFIGTDQGKVTPHMFYQACKVTGKSSTPCIEKKVEGTVLIEIEFEPSKEMVISCDCVGILKERNVDVEQRFPFHHASATQSRKKSTKCRMIFRTTIINSLGQEETLQAASLPILCSQPPGQPEICKQSLTECSAGGGKELFIIGKNFLKDSKVIWQEENNQGEIAWEAKSIPLKDYLQQTHLICIIPSYKDEGINTSVDCKISVWSGGKLSEPHRFTYLPNISAASSMGLLHSPSTSDTNSSQGILMQNSVGQSLTMSPGSSDGQQLSMEMKPVTMSPVSLSPEPLVSSSFVSSPSAMSSACHVSPMSSLDSPVLANQICSPEQQQQAMSEVIPTCNSLGQITPLTFETNIMADTQPTFSTAAEELKTLLEQTTEPSQTYETVTGMTMEDVKQEELLSTTALLDIKPSPTFTTLAPNMSASVVGSSEIGSYQNESGQIISVVTTANFTGGQQQTHFQMDPLMSTAQIPQLLNTSSASSLMNALVNENSQQQQQHQMMPMMTTAAPTVVSPPTVAAPIMGEVIVGSQMTTMHPMVASAPQMIRTTTTTTDGGQVQPGNSVVFINGELQGPIANALTQMSDNELINYINPSCFDQGAF